MFKVNEYFGGKVKSIGLKSDGNKATVGVIAPGVYEFGTTTVEIMKIVSGKLSVLLPDSKTWIECGPGKSFTVPANKKFKVKAQGDTSYLCLYK